MHRKILRIVLNVLLAVIVFWAWGRMVFITKDGVLSSSGLSSLKYFTVLSNLFEGVASLFLAAAFFSGKEKLKRIAGIVKYVAAAEVGLTFFTVIFFLWPTLRDLKILFLGPNFWMHLIVPLAAMGEFIFLNREEIRVKQNFLVLIPMLLYAAVYIPNFLRTGINVWPNPRDWYGFTRFGLPVGILISIGVVGVTFVIGLGLRMLNRLVYGRKTGENGKRPDTRPNQDRRRK